MDMIMEIGRQEREGRNITRCPNRRKQVNKKQRMKIGDGRKQRIKKKKKKDLRSFKRSPHLGLLITDGVRKWGRLEGVDTYLLDDVEGGKEAEEAACPLVYYVSFAIPLCLFFFVQPINEFTPVPRIWFRFLVYCACIMILSGDCVLMCGVGWDDVCSLVLVTWGYSPYHVWGERQMKWRDV